MIMWRWSMTLSVRMIPKIMISPKIIIFGFSVTIPLFPSIVYFFLHVACYCLSPIIALIIIYTDLSWPAVSQIWSLIFSPSISTVLIMKSTPIVAPWPGGNIPWNDHSGKFTPPKLSEHQAKNAKKSDLGEPANQAGLAHSSISHQDNLHKPISILGHFSWLFVVFQCENI